MPFSFRPAGRNGSLAQQVQAYLGTDGARLVGSNAYGDYVVGIVGYVLSAVVYAATLKRNGGHRVVHVKLAAVVAHAACGICKVYHEVAQRQMRAERLAPSGEILFP